MTTLNAVRGNTFRTTFIWSPGGTPVDLTGYTAELVITVNGVSATYTDDDALTITPDDGRVDALIDEADTAEWTCSGAFHLTVTSPDDDPEVTTISSGRIVVS